MERTNDKTVFLNEDGTIKVEWEYTGDGWYGTFDPTDVMDEPLLRFTCYRTTSPNFWSLIPNSSFCTMLTIDAKPEWMEHITRHEILPALNQTNHETLLEDMINTYTTEHFISKEVTS